MKAMTPIPPSIIGTASRQAEGRRAEHEHSLAGIKRGAFFMTFISLKILDISGLHPARIERTMNLQ
jgi:hypothetical protein